MTKSRNQSETSQTPEENEGIHAQRVPVLPLRDVVVFPGTVLPLFVGRCKSIKALEAAIGNDEHKQVLLVAQKDPDVEDPTQDDLYSVGTLASIMQLLKLPDDTVKVLIEGHDRARITSFEEADYFSVACERLLPEEPHGDTLEPLVRTLMAQFERYLKLNKKIPAELLASLSNISEPGRLADTITAHMTLKLTEKQQLLESSNLKERLEKLLDILGTEMDLLKVQIRIQSKVKKNVENTHREFYLNEQMRAIQDELGQGGHDAEEFKEKIEASGMSEEVQEKALAELNKYRMMSPMSAEASVSRNYLETLINMPWKKKTGASIQLLEAKAILDRDHYGLKEVKERILEYLAVQKRVGRVKGSILCLVGPPGVGKTSLAASVAKACQRKYARIALGGVRDEAEIRGHRRTYVGAMPGKILQKMAKVGVRNPLMLLDEVDKMATDPMRGDPASALLEVLDPEQNKHFADHYLEVDYDLSDVLFVATANTLDIPAPLRDRMEIIRLSGYTEDEKMHIAKAHLLPKQRKEHGLSDPALQITDAALLDIIRYHTREAGVRSLERALAKIARKAVTEGMEAHEQSKTHNDHKKKVSAKKWPMPECTVAPERLEHYLGVRRYRFGLAEEDAIIGHVTGLAWTEVGGETLAIEAQFVPGKGKIVRTGKLGEVMQESIQAALTVVRSRAEAWGIQDSFFENHDVHVHLPEGAIPKDGPSAGIGICTALVSAATGIPVRPDVAMTGEITLRGQVLPIGGLKEKLLAARRAGIKHVLYPSENKRELSEVPDNIVAQLTLHPVGWFDEVLRLALVRQVAPRPATASMTSASGLGDVAGVAGH